MNYYSFHIGDYRGATAHLSNDEDLCYRRLLDMYYDTQRPIPLETHWVARRLRVGLEVLEVVLHDFFVSKEDGWHNTKADLIIAEYIAQAEKNRANGKKGGRPPSNKTTQENPVGSQSAPLGLPVETTSKGNQEPITNNQEPITIDIPPSPPAGGKGFDWFTDLPDDLDTPEFREAWLEWVKYRKKIKKPFPPASAPAMWRKVQEAGVQAAIDGFEVSMANGWQGTFPKKKSNDQRHEKRDREFSGRVDVPDL
jgi:uncharacterized protein YdaU (DUF1376 family)